MYKSTEYQNNLVSNNYPEYGSTNSLQYNTLLAQKLPSTVPSMKYPVLLEQSNVYGYDALTHNSDNTGYYNLTSAYGNSCNPSFYVAKCPENSYIRSFPSNSINSSSSCATVSQSISEGYTNSKILMFISPMCKFSQQALMEYRSHPEFNSLFEVLNIENPTNEQKLTNLGGYSTPFFYRSDQNIIVNGYFPYSELLSKMKIQENYQSSSEDKKIKDLKIVAYVAKGCHYCTQLKHLLKDHAHDIIYKDASDPNIREELKHIRGFPTLHSLKTKKTHVGYPGDIKTLIHKLS